MNENRTGIHPETERKLTGGIVMKFGGASLRNSESVRESCQAVGYFIDQNYSPVVVVSAAQGITDLLRAVYDNRGNTNVTSEIFRSIVELQTDIVIGLGMDRDNTLTTLKNVYKDCVNLSNQVFNPDSSSQPYAIYDQIVATGEKMSAHTVAGYMASQGRATFALSSEHIVITDDNFGGARPDRDATKIRAQGIIRGAVRRRGDRTPIITGFIGATQEGAITTLGSNSSDHSAVLFAEALDLHDVFFMKDVDGLFKSTQQIGDPHSLIDTISIQDLAKIPGHDKILCENVKKIALESNIRLHILNYQRPDRIGTTITP